MKHLSLIASRMLLTLMMFLLMFSTSAFAQNPVDHSPTLSTVLSSKVLRVGVNPKFKPFSFEKDGARVGVDIDIANLLAEKLGVHDDGTVPGHRPIQRFAG